MELRNLLFTSLFVPVVASADVIETLIVRGDEPASAFDGAGPVRLAADQQLPGLRIDSAELLQGIPGLQADSRSNYAQDTRLTLRGFGARSAFGVRGIDLQIDGIPLSTPDGQGQLSSVLLDEVTSVEVLSGPLAALYGNGAGGVVALQTSAPDDNRVGVAVLAGDSGRERQAVRGQWREGNLGARVQASHFQTDGDRPNASAERNHAGASLYHTSGQGIETIVRIDASRDPMLRDPLGLTPEQWREDPRQPNTAAQTFDTRKQVRHRQASLAARQPQGEQRWQVALWSGRREVQQWLAFPGGDITSSGGVVDLTRDFTGANANVTRDFTLAGSAASATLGAEWAGMKDSRLGYVNDFGVAGDLRRDETGRVDSRDLYSVLQWQPAERWQLVGGARLSWLDFEVDDHFIVPPEGDQPGNPDDSGSRSYRESSGALAANYHLSERWRAGLSAGWGFETPTLTEMAYRSEGTGLNTELEASRNRQQQLSLRSRDDLATVISLFRIDSRNELVVDQSVGGRTTYRNAAETERRGLEVSGGWLFTDTLSARYSATWLDATYSAGEFSGNQLPGIAKLQVYGQLDWQPWRDPRLTLALSAWHRDEVATADDNATFAPAATTFDLALRSSRDFSDWRLSSWLKLANLTDKNYVGSVIVNQANGRAFEPAPGRNVSAGVELVYGW